MIKVMLMLIFSTLILTPSVSSLTSGRVKALGQKDADNQAMINLIDHPGHPMKVEVKYNGKLIQNNAAFEVTGNDWIKKIELTVRNVTSKEITYFQVVGKFPHSSDGKMIPDIEFAVGRNTALPPEKQRGEIVAVLPSNSISLSLDDLVYQQYIKSIWDFDYPLSLTKYITLYLQMVIYRDDTGWYKGSRIIRDPKNPARWVNADIQTSMDIPVQRRTPAVRGFEITQPTVFSLANYRSGIKPPPTCYRFADFEFVNCFYPHQDCEKQKEKQNEVTTGWNLESVYIDCKVYPENILCLRESSLRVNYGSNCP